MFSRISSCAKAAVVLAVFLTVSALIAHPSYGGGPIHGSKATGMGTAFIGLADDPSAIFHNPAGITQLEGLRTYGGISIVYLTSSFRDNAGNTENTDFQIFAPPHFFLTYQPPASLLTWGFGMHSPFGIGGRRWPRDGLTRYAATEGSIATVALNPTVAIKLTPSFSIAFGADYQLAMTENEKMLDQSAFSAPDGRFRIEGDGAGWGWNFGCLWRISQVIQAGFAYRGPITTDIDGEATITGIAPPLQAAFGGESFRTGAGTTLHFPEIYGLGIAMIPSDRWTFAFDIELARWSSFDRVFTDFETEVPAGGLVDGYAVLDWKDSWLAKIGFERRLKEHIALRGGYTFVQSAVPDKSLEAGNPDSDQHYVNLGLGYESGKWTTDTFASIGFYKSRNVANVFQTGEFDSLSVMAGLSLGYLF